MKKLYAIKKNLRLSFTHSVLFVQLALCVGECFRSVCLQVGACCQLDMTGGFPLSESSLEHRRDKEDHIH